MARLSATEKAARRLQEEEDAIAEALFWMEENPKRNSRRQAAIKFGP
jgi:hypothetical protein